MAIYTVSIFQGGGASVNVGDGTLLANLSVSAGRGPKGDGFTGGSFNASTGVVTFTSNDGLGFATGDLRSDLSEPSPIGDVTPNTGAFTSLSTTGDTVIGGNVGIGTSSPTGLLTLGTTVPRIDFLESDGSAGFDNTALIRDADVFSIQTRNGGTFVSNDYRISTNASGALTHEWRTGNVERLRITSTGNVGIGTSSPQSELDVFGLGDIIRSTAPDAASNFMAFFDATGRKGYFGYGGALDDMTVANERDGFLRFITNGNTRASITSAGDVGIGTASPAEKLDVNGRVSATGFTTPSTNGQVNVRAGNTTSLFDTDFPEATSAAVAVRYFRNTNTTGVRRVQFHTGDGSATIDAQIGVGGTGTFFNSGNVGIGTSIPAEKLSVTGNATISGSLSKGSGSFKIDHPVKPDTHYLVHSFIEGPQADNLYRGKVVLVDGSATVNLDEACRMTEGTFVALNGNVQCFATNEAGWTQVRGKVEGNILTIEAQDTACTDEVSWLVIGERHDQHMLDTSWTDGQGRIITEPEKVIDIQPEINND